MENDSNQGADREDQKPQSDAPLHRQGPAEREKQPGADPAAESEDNASRPDGASHPREKNPTLRRAEEKLKDGQDATESTRERHTPPSALFNGA